MEKPPAEINEKNFDLHANIISQFKSSRVGANRKHEFNEEPEENSAKDATSLEHPKLGSHPQLVGVSKESKAEYIKDMIKFGAESAKEFEPTEQDNQEKTRNSQANPASKVIGMKMKFSQNTDYQRSTSLQRNVSGSKYSSKKQTEFMSLVRSSSLSNIPNKFIYRESAEKFLPYELAET